jgi:cell division topological specificity factor
MSGLLSYFKKRNNNSAAIARDRLSVLIATDRHLDTGANSFLPQMREEILAVIAKYINIDRNEVKVMMERNEGIDMLEIDIPLK